MPVKGCWDQWRLGSWLLGLCFSCLLLEGTRVREGEKGLVQAFNPLEGSSSASLFLIGPVVGHVNETYGRILVEAAAEATVKVMVFEVNSEQGQQQRFRRQNNDGNGRTLAYSYRQQLVGHRPSVLVLQNLVPMTSYEVVIEGTDSTSSSNRQQSLTARFRTLNPDHPHARLAVVSCNDFANFDEKKEMDTWLRLKDELPTIDYILHIGDQVYLDGELYKLEDKHPISLLQKSKIHAKSMWSQCRELIHQAGPTKAQWLTRKEECLERFRSVYRTTWGRPEVAAVLASVPNVMVADDHEFRDDFGDRPEDSDPQSCECVIGTFAAQVYHEYQTQLQRDVDFPLQVKEKAYSAHTFFNHRLGLFLWDLRVERSIRKANGAGQGGDWVQEGYLGPEQHADFERALSTTFQDVQQLIIATPTPLAITSACLDDFISVFENDVVGTWEAPKYRQERNRVLQRIAKWLHAKPSRSVLFVAGDIHIAGHSSITIKSGCSTNRIATQEYKIHQFISSAMASEQKIPPAVVEITAGGVLKADSRLWNENEVGFQVEHDRYFYPNNFGILDVTFAANGNERPKVHGTLFIESDKRFEIDLTTASWPSMQPCPSIS